MEVEVTTTSGFIGRSIAFGSFNELLKRWNCVTVKIAMLVKAPKAVANVNRVIAPALLGLNVLDQLKIDQTMLDLDGLIIKIRCKCHLGCRRFTSGGYGCWFAFVCLFGWCVCT